MASSSSEVTDETDLTTLHGRDGQFKRLVENCFSDEVDGNVTLLEMRFFTMDEFLDSYAKDQPKRRGKLLAWISHYRLESHFKPEQVSFCLD